MENGDPSSEYMRTRFLFKLWQVSIKASFLFISEKYPLSDCARTCFSLYSWMAIWVAPSLGLLQVKWTWTVFFMTLHESMFSPTSCGAAVASAGTVQRRHWATVLTTHKIQLSPSVPTLGIGALFGFTSFHDAFCRGFNLHSLVADDVIYSQACLPHVTTYVCLDEVSWRCFPTFFLLFGWVLRFTEMSALAKELGQRAVRRKT